MTATFALLLATGQWRRVKGFTLLELLVVLAVVAMGTAGVALALRDTRDAALETEGLRLAALFESARAQSRASGRVVQWTVTPTGFQFQGLPDGALPMTWLTQGVTARSSSPVILGPEPVIGAQAVELMSVQPPQRSLFIFTSGLRPFALKSDTQLQAN